MDMIKKSVEKVDTLRPPSPPPKQAPWLIYTHGTSKKKQIQTFFTIADNNSYIKSIPNLRGKSICGSCHGWLILRDSIDPKQFSLCNLVTEQSLLLPPLPSLPMSTLGETKLSTCTLTSPPYSEDCILFLFFTDQVFSCRPKSKDEDGTSISSICSWVSQKVDIDGKRTGLYSAISHKGFIYCCALSPVHRILLLCMKVNTLTKFLQLEEPICAFRRACSDYYMVESCGHIYWVCPCSRYGQDLSINNVEIWELDMHSKKWVRVKCLGGRAFFVGPNCSTWCWASNGLQENCVYLLVPSENDKIFYSYSLDEKSLTLFRPLPNLQTPYSTPVWFNAMPQHEHQSGLCQVIDPSRDDSHSNILQVSSDPFTVDCSKDGWIVVCLRESIKFFNPFMRIKGDFPPIMILTHEASGIGFSTNPTSPDCLTVLFENHVEGVVIFYLRYGDETWTRCQFVDEDVISFDVVTTSSVYFGGAFYVLDVEGHLGEFKLVGDEESWQVYDYPIEVDMRLHSCHLVECDGELFAVYIGYMGAWIKVFNFINHSNKKWVQVETLGNYSLFINNSSSFSKEITEEMGIRNRIYLSRLYGDSIIFYSFNTGKFHIDGGDGSWNDFSSTKKPLRSCWI